MPISNKGLVLSVAEVNKDCDFETLQYGAYHARNELDIYETATLKCYYHLNFTNKKQNIFS